MGRGGTRRKRKLKYSYREAISGLGERLASGHTPRRAWPKAGGTWRLAKSVIQYCPRRSSAARVRKASALGGGASPGELTWAQATEALWHQLSDCPNPLLREAPPEERAGAQAGTPRQGTLGRGLRSLVSP